MIAKLAHEPAFITSLAMCLRIVLQQEGYTAF